MFPSSELVKAPTSQRQMVVEGLFDDVLLGCEVNGEFTDPQSAGPSWVQRQLARWLAS